MAKGGSKLVTGIISFLLGFLFAIIVEVGVIVGAGYYVLNTDIDALFGLFGIENSDEEDRQYINTDTEADGVKNLMELYGKLMGMYSDIGNVSIGKVETLFPALDGLTGKLYDTLDPYIEIDRAEFESTSFTELPEYVQGLVMDIRPGALMRNAGMEGLLDSNAIVSALLEGVETSYVYADILNKENSAKYPVYYDEYIREVLGGESVYYRTVAVDGLSAYPSNLTAAEWLTDTGRTDADGKEVFRQYYYKVTLGDEDVFVATKRNEDGDFIYSETVDASNTYLSAYGVNYQYLTGHYYYDNDGNQVVVTPITLRSLSENAMEPLYFLSITEIVGDDEIVTQIFGDTSIGELVNGEVSISDKVDNLELATVIDVKATDPVLLYMGYRVTGAIDNNDGTYSAVYAAGTAEEKNVTVYTDAEGKVEKVVDGSGNKIGGVTVGGVSEVVGNVTTALTIADMMDIEPDNMIMSYLAYGISNVKAAESSLAYSHTATYEKQDGSLGTAYVYTKLKGGNTVISYVTKDTPDGERLPCTTIDGVADAVDDIKITSVMQVKADNAIMAYLAYGVTDLIKVNATTYTGKVDGEEVTVTVDGEENITLVERNSDHSVVPGTSIEDISSRLENITKDVALTDVMDVEPTVFDSEGNIVTNNNIMTFIAFSVSDVSYVGGEYYGTYNVYNEDGSLAHEYYCKIIVGSDGFIDYIVYDTNSYLTHPYGGGIYESTGVKTKIDDVPDMINRLTKTLRIKDIVEIDRDNKLMVKLGEYKIDEVGNAIDEFELPDAITIDATDPIMLYLGYGITDLTADSGSGYTHTGKYTYTVDLVETTVDCYVELNGTELVRAYYINGGEEVEISGTTLNSVNERVENLTDNIAISDVMDVTADNNIMMYLAYGLTSVESTADTTVYKAVNGSVDVYVKTDETGKVIGFYSDADCLIPATGVVGTKISGVGDKVDSITNDLTVGDVIDCEGDELLESLAGYKLNELSNAVNELGLDIFVDVEPDSAILMYVTYGVIGVEQVSGEIYSHIGEYNGNICYIKTEGSYVTGVYTDAECTDKVQSTRVNGVSDRIDGLTRDLKLSEIIDIDPNNRVLCLVKDSTIENLDQTVRQISIQRMYTEDIYETEIVDGNEVAKVYAHGKDEINISYVYYIDSECTTFAGNDGKFKSDESGIYRLDENSNKVYVTDETYYTHGATKGIWSMLLKSGGTEKVYTLNNIDDMVGAATNNIKDGTLGDLKAAGIINMTDEDLAKSFYGHNLGSLKLSELISLVVSMAS